MCVSLCCNVGHIVLKCAVILPSITYWSLNLVFVAEVSSITWGCENYFDFIV